MKMLHERIYQKLLQSLGKSMKVMINSSVEVYN